MIKKTATLIAVLLIIGAVTALAGDKTEAKHADFEGTLVCLGCDLKNAEDARSACSVFGHTHALKTDDGKYINFLENQYSTDLLDGGKYHNKDVKVHGIYHASANLLDVETFSVDGKSKNWCSHCKTMDSCMAGK
ncbi:MAG: hypothetical protein GY839_03020 [candidate division Zixibacteria bacterium]|nr:hypothetical protein [candidate division Zixibacteria bacterium]